jgi:hypothetical protein
MRPIPPSIKSQIIRKFLEGYSIPEISKQTRVSVGTISTLTTEESKNDEYFLYMREIAKKFKGKGLKFSEVISGIRLYHKITNLGLTCLFFEDFLESTNTESFRLGMDLYEFLEKIKRIRKVERQYNLKLEDIPAYIKNEKAELENLKQDKRDMIESVMNLYERFYVTKTNIEEYLTEREQYLKYKSILENVPSYLDWIINSDERYKKASKKSGLKIDQKILYNKLNSIYKEPDKHLDIVKQIMNP